jgi:hypothetical protein
MASPPRRQISCGSVISPSTAASGAASRCHRYSMQLSWVSSDQ